MNLVNEQGVSVHPSTEVFKMIDFNTINKAEDFAKKARSYVFTIFYYDNCPVKNRKVRFTYGFGVPK